MNPLDIDPERHVREKQANREADARALASGEKSRSQLTAENSLVRREWIAVDEINYSQMIF